MAEERKVALVLTGGGAKGAFQFAAEKYAREAMGYKWDVIAGVSVGALNGAMLAMGKYQELDEIWNHTLMRERIYTGDLGSWTLLGFALKQLPGLLGLSPRLVESRAILGNGPLRRLIDRHFQRDRVTIDLRIGVVSLETGRYYVYKLVNGEVYERRDRGGHTGDYMYAHVDDATFKQIILASTTIPVVWAPQAIGMLGSAVDGGIRNINPIGDVLDTLQSPDDEVVVISCDPKEPPQTRTPQTGVQVAKRSLDLVLAEIVRTDIREFERINFIVRQAEEKGVTIENERGDPFVSYKATVIQPDEPLDDALDFSPDAIKRSMAKGRTAARQVLGDPA